MRNDTELRKYQQRIATFLYENDEALCVARPGGGKTIAALTAIKEQIDNEVIRQALVLAPKRVATKVWPDEIAEWAHTAGLTYQLLSGYPSDRRMQLHRALRERDNIIICGHELVPWLFAELEETPDDAEIFDLLVIDEISRLRNPTGVRAKLIAKNAHRWRGRWGLSGTLRPNSALDLFVPARVITKDKLWGKSFYKWQSARFYPTDRQGYGWAPLPGENDKINAEIEPYIVTLQENEYPQLPKMSVVFDRIELPPGVRKEYDRMETKLFAKMVDGKKVVAANAAVSVGKLAQIANGFVYDTEDGSAARELHDEKANWLADIIENATGPTLLIYEYEHDLALMREMLPDMPWLGGGAKMSDRVIDEWNAGKHPFMALHPASGGHGLNLQKGGCDMAWMAPCWSPEFWEQTLHRINRSGQTKPVIIRVCVADNTVDELKINRVHYKMNGQDAFEAYMRKRQLA